jgi:hypothetical protein
MKYFALSFLLVAFYMQAGDKPREMAPGTFTFNDPLASKNLDKYKKVPIIIIHHHLKTDCPATRTQQLVDNPVSKQRPKPVDLKLRKQRKKDSQYTMRPSRRNNNNNTTCLIYGLVSPVGHEIAFAPGQGVISVFTISSSNQAENAPRKD